MEFHIPTTITPTRTWTSTAIDDGSIHCLGNGHLCVYEQGPNIIQLFGPPYSSPMLGTLTLDVPGELMVRSQREPGTAIWTHQFVTHGEVWAEMVDFVDATLPCLVRHIRTQRPIRLNWHTDRQAINDRSSGWLYEIPAGTPYYSHYPYPQPQYYHVNWRGALALLEGNAGWACNVGESRLFFVGGPAYPQVIENTEAALAQPVEAMLARTRKAWQIFTQRRRDWPAALPTSLPYRESLLQAVDDVAVLIKAQQSAEGGVLAGHNYHLCYVRDQYGVSRGLLAAGHPAEAKAILNFYWRIWQRYGCIHNAQAAGVDGSFHVHENDEVEITGYLIRQAFDLLQHTGDADFVNGIFPMLAWAYQAQKRHLIGGMLPFNGDETYVAGGILPRSTLNDGSAEATLLFLDSGARLVDWAAQHRHWCEGQLCTERALLSQVKAAYRPNFFVQGKLITNNPIRACLPGSAPRFRHGVCECCIAEGHFKAIGWTQRSATGRYLCPECLAEGDYVPTAARQYILQSVSLTPLYFQSDLLTKEELRPLVEEIWQAYQLSGRLPSRPGDARDVAVGYDYGFLLYALTALGHPAAQQIAQKTLSLVDSTGAWVEYYLSHRPSGTRCRPWESAINLEALLHWATSRGG
jgi:hypothetical protein